MKLSFFGAAHAVTGTRQNGSVVPEHIGHDLRQRGLSHLYGDKQGIPHRRRDISNT